MAIRTYQELREAAEKAGYKADKAVTRARTFAACMTEASTGEAVKLVALRMKHGLPIEVGEVIEPENADPVVNTKDTNSERGDT